MIFAWALLAGGFSMAALAGYWIVLGRCVRIPVNAVPDLSDYPWQTTTLVLVMGALVSAVLEQAGFFGYCQSVLEREFSGVSAIVILSVLFALLPHPPPGAVLVPKLLFFLLTGATFAVLAYLTNSITPGIVVQSLGLLSFFIFVFPYDTTRPLIAETGTDAWFWAHVAQMIVCAAMAFVAFWRLARVQMMVKDMGMNLPQ
jgi:membrane protease YdiL (CAAX protease family)